MRKLLCSLLLPLLLLLTQQGALVHELSHHERTGDAAAQPVDGRAADVADVANAADPASSPDAPASPHAGHALCGLCLAFAHLAGPLASTPPALVLLDLHHAVANAVPLASLSADAPTARSRGPPSFL